MTTVFFVRHAEPNYQNHDDASRELSLKGLADRKLVTEFLSNKLVNKVFSSPYKRAIDTIKDFTDKYNHQIILIDDFRERKVGNQWISNFSKFSAEQWSDFDYKLEDGESLKETQTRNVNALNKILKQNKDKTIVVGSHGTALSTIINYFDKSFAYSDFKKIQFLMPWIVRFDFKNYDCVNIKMKNLFDIKEN